MLDIAIQTYVVATSITPTCVDCVRRAWFSFYNSSFSNQWFMGGVGALTLGGSRYVIVV